MPKPDTPPPADAAADPPIDVAVSTTSGPGSTTKQFTVPHRDRKVRRRVREMAATLAYTPTAGDLFALTRWAALYDRWRSIGERLAEPGGDAKTDGTPKKMLDVWLRLSAELRALEASLGITAAARAGLGLDVARGRALDLAADHAEAP